MNKYKKLISNSIIFAIGNFGSKIITIILVPIYTYYLTTAEYGAIDIIATTINVLLPIISLSIYEAVLRFAMEKNETKESVLTNAFLVTIIGSLVTLLTYPFFSYFNVFENTLVYVYIILILQAFQSLIAQFTRAIGKVKLYAINGIIQTLSLGFCNVLFLVILNLGFYGYLISLVVSQIISILFLLITVKIFRNIKIKSVNKHLMKIMLIYSSPLIVNSFLWWLMNASNRYFLLYYEGVETNGLYAVANKIPILLTVFTGIFLQAWQLSAIEEYDSEAKSQFYSKVFNYYQTLLFLGASFVLVILKCMMFVVFDQAYYMAWEFVPFLLLGGVFQSFSGFLGTNYIAAKETRGFFVTSIIGGALSVILNLILIPIIGGVGAGISIMVSSFFVWIVRIQDTKRFIIIDIQIKKLTINLILIMLQIIILFLCFNAFWEFVFLSIIFILLVICDRVLIIYLIKAFMRSLKPAL